MQARHSQYQLDCIRKDKALDLREKMFVALFESHGLPFRDSNTASRRRERSIAELEATQRQEARSQQARRARSQTVRPRNQ